MFNDFDDLNLINARDQTTESSTQEVTHDQNLTIQVTDTPKKTVKFSKYNSSTVSVQMFAAPPVKDSEFLDRKKRMIPETAFLDERITDQIDNHMMRSLRAPA